LKKKKYIYIYLTDKLLNGSVCPQASELIFKTIHVKSRLPYHIEESKVDFVCGNSN